MPLTSGRNIRRTATIIETEILRSAAGLDDIKSMVLDSTKLLENPSSSGLIILESGEVMGKISGSSKIMPIRYGNFGTGSAGAWTAADIVGVNETQYQFPKDITLGAATDHELAILHHGCDFNISKLKGYTGNETITKAALPTCIFR